LQTLRENGVAGEDEKGDAAEDGKDPGGIELAAFRSDLAKAPDMTPDHKAWFVIRSKPRKEDFSVRNLARREVTAFCPHILEPVGWANDWATVPLFPGYLFVEIELEHSYYAVVWTPGVKGFVAFGDVPTPVRPEIVHFLQQETGEDGVIRPLRHLRQGERVRIRRGPLAGLVGIIDKPCSERGRIRVLMDFLRQGTVVEVPIAAVGRA
jgi:transcription antitermination factor NusG